MTASRCKPLYLLRTIAVLGLALLWSGPVRAATDTWNPGSSGSWGTAGNWSIAVPGSGDIALFSSASYTYQPSLTSTASLGGIWDTGSGSLSISGSTLALYGTTIGSSGTGIQMDPGAGALSISSTLRLAGAQSWVNNSTNPLTVSGNVANGGYLLTLGGIGSIAMSSSLTGSGGLQQNGSGTTTISATAGLTYTGGTTVNAGKLSFYGGTNGGTPVTTTFAINGGDLDFLNGAYMGSAGNVTFGLGGGTLSQEGGGMTPYGGTLTISTSAGAAQSQITGVINISYNPVVFNVSRGTNPVSDLDLPGAFPYFVNASTNGTVTKNGNGILEVDGAGAYNGPINIGGGTLLFGGGADLNWGNNYSGAISDSGTLAWGSTASQSFSSTSVISGTGNLTVSAGVLTLSGTNNSYNGGTTVFGGTLKLGNSGALSTGSVCVADGLLSLNGYSPTVSSFTLSSGTLGGTGTLTAPAYNLLAGTVTANLGAGPLNMTTAGVVTVSGNFGGSTLNISAGTLNLNGTASSASAFNVSSGAVVTLGSAGRMGSGTALSLSGQLTLGGAESIGSLSLTGGTLAGSGKTLSVSSPINPQSGTISANLGGSTALNVTAGGSVLLSGSNSYTGGTTVGGGVLQLGSALALPGTGSLTMTSGTLDLYGFSPTVGMLAGTGGTVTTSAGAATLTAGSGGVSSTFGGVLADGGGALRLVKVGSGVLTLNGANAYSGGTSISAGILEFGTAASLPSSGTANVAGGAVLAVAVGGSGWTSGNIDSLLANSSVTFQSGGALGFDTTAGNFSYGTSISKANLGLVAMGTNTLTLTGSNTYTGGTTVTAGTLALGGGGSLGASGTYSSAIAIANGAALVVSTSSNQTFAGAIANNGALVVNSGGNIAISGSLSGSGGFQQNGSGTTTISATAGLTYTGPTTVNAGKLSVTNFGNGPTSAFVINAGDLDFPNGAFMGSAGNVTFGPLGGGTLSQEGANNYMTPYGGSLTISTSGGAQSQITGGINLSWNSVVFNVSRGSNPVSDLDLTGTFLYPVQSQTGTVTKNGNGILEIDGAGAYNGPINIGGGTLLFGGGAALNWGNNYAGAIADSGTLAWGSTASESFSSTSVISGPGGLTVSAGVLTLSGSNTYSGGTTVSGGTLAVNNVGALGTGNVSVAGGAMNLYSSPTVPSFTLSSGTVAGSGTLTAPSYNLLAGTVTANLGAGTLNMNGAGTAVYLDGSNAASAVNIISAGTLTLAGAGNFGGGNYSGALNVNGVLNHTANSAQQLYGTITGTGAIVQNNSSASNYYLYISGNIISGFQGRFVNAAGTTYLNTSAGPGAATLEVDGGTVGVGFGSGETWSLGALVGSGGRVQPDLGSSGTCVLSVGALNTTTTYQGVLADETASDNLALIKTGTGALTLAGANTYSGGTTVNGGGLVVNGSLANAAVSVAGGASLGGTGSIAGPVSLASGTSAATQAAINLVDGTIGTLTLSSPGTALTLGSVSSGTAVLDFEFGSGGADSLALTAGNVILNAPTEINLTNIGTLAAGTFNLITSQQITKNAGADFYLAPTSLNFGGGLSASLLTSGGSEQLIIGLGYPSNAWWLSTAGSWSTPSNWGLSSSGSLATQYPGGGTSNLYFGATAGTATVDTNFNVATLNFSYGTLGVGTTQSVLINGAGTLTISGSGVVDNGEAAQTISAPIAINGPQTWTIGGSQPLTVSGVISGPSTASLTVAGSGTLILAAANTYAGGTTISGGTLQLGDGSAHNGSVTGNIADNGTLAFANCTPQTYANAISGTGAVNVNGPATLTLTGNIAVSGATTISGGTLQLGDGNNNGSVAGSITDNAMLVFANGTAQNFSATIGGSGGVTVAGPGVLTLSASNGYSGGTTIQNGSLVLANNSALGTGSVLLSGGTLAGSGQIGLVTAQAGTITANLGGSGGLDTTSGIVLLSGNNSYTGGTTIQGGTLVLAGNSALGTGGVLLSSGSLNLNGYANSATGLTLTGGTLAGSGQLGLITAQGGAITANLGGSGGLNTTAGIVLLSGNNSYTGGTTVSGSGVLQVGSAAALPSTGSLTVNSGTLDLNSFSPTVGVLAGSAGTITSSAAGISLTLTAGSGDGSSAFGGVLRDGGGTLGLVKTGGGTLTLNGANGYSGGTTVAGGVLQLGNSLALGATSGGLTVNGGTLDLANNNPTVGALAGGSGAIRGAGVLTVNTTAASDFSGAIVDGVGLVVTGSGMLTLHAANTYTGGTTISGGTLGLADAGNLGSSAGSVTIGAATLQTTGAVALDNAIQLTDPGSTLAVPNSTDTLTLNGLVSGSGALNKIGAGNLALANPSGNTYTGDTNVLAGTLLAEADNALSPNSNLVISDGASVILDFGGGAGNDSIGGFAAGVPQFATPTLAAPALSPVGISTVPEPSTLMLLLVGSLASLIVWWRRSR